MSLHNDNNRERSVIVGSPTSPNNLKYKRQYLRLIICLNLTVITVIHQKITRGKDMTGQCRVLNRKIDQNENYSNVKTRLFPLTIKVHQKRQLLIVIKFNYSILYS